MKKWKQTKVKNNLYNLRFKYFESANGKGTTHFARTTRLWYTPLYTLAVFMGWDTPYWLSRFWHKTDAYNLTNWEYLQYSVFGRWSKVETQTMVCGKQTSAYSYKAVDKEKFELSRGKPLWNR